MNYVQKYADFLKGFLDLSSPVRVVFDCSNGAVGPVLKEFAGLENLEAVLINEKMDGDFPAHGPDPLAGGATDDLAEAIQKHKADFGAVFDSDGDRVVFLDERGRLIHSYGVFLCLKDFFDPPYVVNVNALADFTMPEVEVIEEKVGRFHIINTMRERRAGFGAEHSSHYYFKEFFYSDSGILGALFMANFISRAKQDGLVASQAVDELVGVEWPLEMNYQMEDKEGAIRRVKEYYEKDPACKLKDLDGTSVIGPDFAFNVRVSNTEPLLRINIAAKNRKTLDEKLSELKKVLGVQ